MLKIELTAQQYAVFMAHPMEKEWPLTYADQACKGVQRSLLTIPFKQSRTGNVRCLE
jgi:hypothetical protein